MSRKTGLIFCALLLFTVSSAALTTQETKIDFGDKATIQDYEIRFEASQGETTFTVGRWTETSFHVIKELEGAEIYDAEGKEMQISDNMSLTLESTGFDDSGRFARVALTADKGFFTSGEMTTSTPENLIIQQGDSSDIPLTLENTGFTNQSYNLDYETNSSLTASYSFQDFNVTDVYIPAGEQNSVTAKISAPETAETGTYQLKLTAGNSSDLRQTFQVEIRGKEIEKEMGLDVEERFKQVQPGGNIQIPITVNNGGGFYRGGNSEGPVLDNVTFDVAAPDGWNYELNPSRFSTLEYRDRGQSVLTVEVPENAQSGDFFVEISASSNEASIEEPTELRVNIQERNSMGYIGVFLMAVSFGLLVFVYRKFGRR